MKNRYLKYIGFLIGIIIIYFLVKKFTTINNQIDWKNIHINYLYLVLSVIIFVSAYFIDVFAWQTILKQLQVKIPFSKGFVVLAFSNMGKYIPGKIFSVIGRIAVDTNNKSIVLLSVFVEMIFLSISAFFFSIYVIYDIWHINPAILVLSLLILLILLRPFFINSALKFIWGKQDKKKEWEGSYFKNLGIFGLYLLSWIWKGMAFFIMIKSVYTDINISNLFYIGGSFALSWMIGFFAIIVPGGIGVREGILSLSLSGFIPEAMAIILSLFARIWIMIIELIALIVAIIISKKIIKTG